MPGTSLEDMQLLSRSKTGDVAAFTALVRRYEDRVYNLAHRMVGNASDAADVSQEAFLAAYEGLARFRGEAAFYTWLYRIVVNKALVYRRRRDSRAEVTIQSEDPSALDVAPAAGGDPQETAVRKERQEAVEKAISSLQDDYRAVVVLKDIEGFEYEEIAEILNVALGTVKSRLHRGRILLREALKRHLGAAR